MGKTPNILFFLADQHRGDWLGFYEKLPLKTPNIDALAEEGICFTRACCPSPLCAPSRASLAAGKRVSKTGVLNNDYILSDEMDNFYKHLRAAGYKVGSVGKNDLHKKIFDNGIEGWTARMGRLGFTDTVDSAGKWNTLTSLVADNRDEAWREGKLQQFIEKFKEDGTIDFESIKPRDPYMAYLFENNVADIHIRDYLNRFISDHESYHASPLERRFYADDFVGQEGAKMLNKFPVDEPWFLQVNFSGPHDPFDAPEELLKEWEGVEFPLPSDEDIQKTNLTKEEHQKVRRNYAAQIQGIDEWVGRVIEEVKKRGELENTMIVYASDHGEMLGDHGLWKKSVFYESSLRVPMVLSGKGVNKKSVQSEALVDLIDLAPTFLDIASLDIPEDWDGKSLLNLMQNDDGQHSRVQISILNDNYMVFDGRWKFINRAGDIVLFDLLNDPVEEHNVVDKHPEVVEELLNEYRKGIQHG